MLSRYSMRLLQLGLITVLLAGCGSGASDSPPAASISPDLVGPSQETDETQRSEPAPVVESTNNTIVQSPAETTPRSECEIKRSLIS